MKDWARLERRFLQDPVPTRLGHVACDLATVASLSADTLHSDAVAIFLDEARLFIDWTAADLEPSQRAEMLALREDLELWLEAWREESRGPCLRALLARQARAWSQRVLDLSGLAAAAPEPAREPVSS